VLHGLAAGELQVGHAAVAEHHGEKRQAPAGGAQSDGAGMGPVDLGGFAGGEGQSQIGRAARRTHRAHVVLEDAVAAGVAVLAAQLLIDLHRTEGVPFQPAHDHGLEAIQFARTPGNAAGREALHAGVAGHGFGIQPQVMRDLAE